MEFHKAENLWSAKNVDYEKAKVTEKTTRRLHGAVLVTIAAANERVDAAKVKFLAASKKLNTTTKNLNTLRTKDITMQGNINTYAAQTVTARKIRVEAGAARDAVKDRYEKAVAGLSQTTRGPEVTGSAGASIAGQKRKTLTPSSQESTEKDSLKKPKQV
jgi:hypothetical protein